MTTTRIEYLLDRYYKQEATPEEATELMAYISQHPEAQERLSTLLQQQWEALPVADAQFGAGSGKQMLDHILDKRKPRIFHSLYHYGWAAAVLLLIAVTAAFFIMRTPSAPVVAKHQPIKPGSSKAVLTLADGTTVPLDSTGRQIIKQGNVTVSQQGGQLLYAGADNAAGNNTLSTPRGGQFRITLPDGTQAWLNAASSITYPTVFTGNERNVSITGEVYFEVAAMAGKPFQVKINEAASVQVLGTQFNVNAYTDGPSISTTLLQGKVKVISGSTEGVILKPGQQARTDDKGTTIIDNVDTEQAVAWKNGIFNFEGKDLPEVMRQLSRWYDIDVVFTGKIPVRKFGGEMQRALQLDQVLKIMEKMDVKYKIEGNKLVVLPE